MPIARIFTNKDASTYDSLFSTATASIVNSKMVLISVQPHGHNSAAAESFCIIGVQEHENTSGPMPITTRIPSAITAFTLPLCLIVLDSTMNTVV